MERQHYYIAKKRVKKVKSFYTNLFSWFVVSCFLIALNVFTMWDDPDPFAWAAFPILGWGLGVAFHAFDVFGFGKNWEEKRIIEEMQKLQEADEAKKWLMDRRQQEITEQELPTLSEEEEELELKEFKKLRKEWDDQEYV